MTSWRDVLVALSIALLMPFLVGFAAAFMVPPLCWWLEARQRRRSATKSALPAERRAGDILRAHLQGQKGRTH